MTRQKLLTAHGRKQLNRLRAGAPWAATLLTVVLAVLLGGCVTAAGAKCQRLPDGSFTCSGEVNGM